MIIVLIKFIFVLFLFQYSNSVTSYFQEECSLNLVETIPIGVSFSTGSPSYTSTGDAWLQLIKMGTKSIDIGSYYWTLKGEDVIPDPSAATGEAVFAALKEKGSLLRIAMNAIEKDPDTEELMRDKAQVRQLNMSVLLGAGILHTKFIIVDQIHFYVGSANMDWRSLAQVKELGIVGKNCPDLAKDLTKIFDVYWELGGKTSVPDHWPPELSTEYNSNSPAQVMAGGRQYSAFFSSSPSSLSPNGRTNDIDAILITIQRAKKFVHIAVMDYFPMFLYSSKGRFWSLIDDELRNAYVSRGVIVKLLVSKWAHTGKEMLPFLQSLTALNGLHSKSSIEVKWFIVPTNATLDKIPFARVNHNKYMVTDQAALIGTSNWSADYFTDTAGVSLILSSTSNSSDTVQKQLNKVFIRDWYSEFSEPISN